MTYVPPDRDAGHGGDQLDQTQQLSSAPGALPSVGNGVAGGQDAPFRPEASPTVPFASDRGEAGPDAQYTDAGPRRDRHVFQVVWEAILVLLVLNALFLVYQRRDEVLGGGPLSDALDEHLFYVVPVLLVALGLGLSLRFGAVNLALPMLAAVVASAPGLFVGSNPWIGLVLTAAAAAVVTVGFGLLVLVFRVPPWLAGMAVSAGVVAMLPLLDGEVFGRDLPEPTTWDSPGGVWLLLGAAVIAVGGGLIGLSSKVRDRMSAVKEAVDGTGERDAGTVFAFLGSAFAAALLAGLAGFVWRVFSETGDQESAFSLSLLPLSFFVTLELFALIAVFLAGTSPRGRRGGVFGTLLTVILLWAVYLLWGSFESETGDTNRFQRWSGLLGFGMLVFGLAMAAVLDRLGRPKARPPEEEADADGATQPFDPQPNLFEPEPAAAPR